MPDLDQAAWCPPDPARDLGHGWGCSVAGKHRAFGWRWFYKKIIVSSCRKIGSVQETMLVSLKPLIFCFQNQNLNKVLITLAKLLLIIMKIANLTFGENG